MTSQAKGAALKGAVRHLQENLEAALTAAKRACTAKGAELSAL